MNKGYNKYLMERLLVEDDYESQDVDNDMKAKQIFDQRETPIISSDAKMKSKIYAVVKECLSGLYSDDNWEPVHKFANEMRKILPNFTMYNAKYRGDFPHTSKTWECIGSFKDIKGSDRVVVGTLTASGAGSVKDPLERYDVNCPLNIIYPKNITDQTAKDILNANGVNI